MANTLYDTSRQMFLEGQLNWGDDTVKVALVDTNAYTPNVATHEHTDDKHANNLISMDVYQYMANGFSSGVTIGASVGTAVVSIKSEQYGILRILHSATDRVQNLIKNTCRLKLLQTRGTMSDFGRRFCFRRHCVIFRPAVRNEDRRVR